MINGWLIFILQSPEMNVLVENRHWEYLPRGKDFDVNSFQINKMISLIVFPQHSVNNIYVYFNNIMCFMITMMLLELVYVIKNPIKV